MKFQQFTTKPSVVNAVQWDGVDPEVFPEFRQLGSARVVKPNANGLESYAYPGDWIVINPDGTFRVVSSIQMALDYVPVLSDQDIKESECVNQCDTNEVIFFGRKFSLISDNVNE